MAKPLTPEEYLKKIAKEDRDTIVNLQDRKPIAMVPTGSWVLNQIIGDGSMTGKPGGFPRGHIVELLGDESSGKTTLALSSIRQAQEMGNLGILIDFEQTFHPAYAEKIGLSTDPNKLIVTQPAHFQQGARQIKDFLVGLKPALIVVDSVSAMIPKQVLEGEVDEASRIGLQAQLMSSFLAYISKFLKNSGSCLLFTNQLRSIIKKSIYETGPNEEGSGGRSLRYYSSVRIKLKKSTVEHVNTKSVITGKTEKEPVNITVKATVIKNKIDKPYFTAPLYIRFGEGIDNISSVIDLALNTGLIKKDTKGLSYSQDGKLVHKASSRDKFWNALNESEELFNIIKGNLKVQQDTQAKEEYAPLENEAQPDVLDDMLDNVASTFIEKKEKKEKKKTGDDEE